MKLILATENENKVREIKAILGCAFDSITSLRDTGIILDAEETGSTFEENALIKARCVFEQVKNTDTAVLADDSGLSVDALDGAPGVYSARFAGDNHNDDANNAKLLSLMESVPNGMRGCEFVCVLALILPDGISITVEGKCRGELLHAPTGQNGFGYDPLFFTPEFNCSFAELTPEQKNSISHRKLALERARNMLHELLGDG